MLLPPHAAGARRQSRATMVDATMELLILI